jgi:hypothetical protein
MYHKQTTTISFGHRTNEFQSTKFNVPKVLKIMSPQSFVQDEKAKAILC